MESTLGKLTSRDFWRGMIMAVGTPVLILFQQIIPSWTPLLDDLLGQSGALISQAALSALATYLLKNLGTDDTKAAIKTIQKQGGTVKDATGAEVTSVPKKSIAPDM